MASRRVFRRLAGAAGPALALAGAFAAALAVAAIAMPARAQLADSVFGATAAPVAAPPASIGSYARGCLSGGVELAETAPGWQAMRLSRNRNWGHPEMIAFLGRLSAAARGIGWPGLYVGDIGQPRGGPMRSGHRSHQIGLDVDVWLRRPGGNPLDRAERERIGSVNVVAADGVGLTGAWTPEHHRIIRAAAEDPAVARIFVNAAIKRGMCAAERGAGGRIDAAWLRKVRPWKGHDHHFHVRLACPPGAGGCVDQAPPPPGDGCGAELAHWFPGGTRSLSAALGREDEEAPGLAAATRGLSRGLTLDDLPQACRAVAAGAAPTGLAAARADMTAPTVPAMPAAPAPPAGPVFPAERAEAHSGFLGTRYFWIPPVDRTVAGARQVALRIDGALPPGLEFRDRGGGNGLVTGVPAASGRFSFDIVAHTQGAQEGRIVVTLPVEQLRAQSADQGAGQGADESAASLPSLRHRVRDFAVNFAGAECFHAAPVTVAAARIEVEAFADASAPFHDFDTAFRAAMATEAAVGGRLVTPAQCAALALARDFPHPAPPRLALADPDHLLAQGQRLEATVTGGETRYLTPFLVGPGGTATDLSGAMRLDGPARIIDTATPGPGKHLLVLADTLFPLLADDYAGAGGILTALRTGSAARAGDLRVSLGYFVVD